MTSKGTLATGNYAKATLAMAIEYSDFVIGFIAREKLIDHPRFIHMTPGVHLQQEGDNLGQQYLTPQQVILQNKSDLIIVGRGIYHADNPKNAAHAYRQVGWHAYQQRLAQ